MDLGAGFGVCFVGERASDLENGLEIPDYTLFDASVLYRYGPLGASVKVKHLTDEVPYDGTSFAAWILGFAEQGAGPWLHGN